MTNPTPSSNEIKMKQYRNLLIIASILVVLAGLAYYIMSADSTDNASKKKVDTASFVSPVDEINPQSVWMERAQTKFKEQERQTADLKNEITQLKALDNQKSITDNPQFKELQKQNEILQTALKAKNDSAQQTIQSGASYNGQIFTTTPGANFNNSMSDKQIINQEPVAIDNDILDLKSSNLNPTPQKNPDSYVPSGTFAQAIMLGAADASAGVQSQANPSPMLFRLTANGTLPNHKTSHLKDCVVTAAVVGDISSERGLIRLERLSCTYPNGEIVELPVEGTIFGMDAKNGVRGNPVWREEALLGRAAVAGTLSGLGSAVSQSYTTNSISPLGSTQTVNGSEIFKYGAAQGASNAMEKLADYNIRRAEQYHPVIQLTAGQPVDVVFLKGFYLDGRKHDENNENSTTTSQLFPSSNQTSTGLTLSEGEMEKIKQNEKSLGVVSNEQAGGMQ